MTPRARAVKNPSSQEQGLEAIPSSLVDSKGRIKFGTYLGAPEKLSQAFESAAALQKNRFRSLRLKRWHYVSLVGPECIITCALVDIGWTSTCFVYFLDRKTATPLFDRSFHGIPKIQTSVSDSLGAGSFSRFTALKSGVILERLSDSALWRLRVDGPDGLKITAHIHGEVDVPAITAIAPIDGGIANCTVKRACLPVDGRAEAGGKIYDLDECFGFMDSTYGYLARRTRWFWASASSENLGFNLVDEFNDSLENVVWVDDAPVPVGPVRFEYDPTFPDRPWTIRSREPRKYASSVDLIFRPIGVRRDEINLLVASNRYVQPVGAFEGKITLADRVIEVKDLYGVTERHETEW